MLQQREDGSEGGKESEGRTGGKLDRFSDLRQSKCSGAGYAEATFLQDGRRELVEQDVPLSGHYAEGFESHYIRHTVPETEHILAENGELFDALTTGQTLCGTIFGCDSVIRKIAAAIVIAHFEERLVFSPYEIKDGKLETKDIELFEREIPSLCHFFDNEKEFRLIRRESRGDVIERLFTRDEEEKMDRDLLYAEDVLVNKEYADMEGNPEKLRVINRYRYSENDTLVLKDYRLAYADGDEG